MAKFEAKISDDNIEINMQQVSAFYSGTATAGTTVKAYDPFMYNDLYGYASTGHDGATIARAYVISQGPQSSATMKPYGYPSIIKYKINDGTLRALISNIYGNDISIRNPVAFIGVNHNSTLHLCKIRCAIVASATTIDPAANIGTIKIVVTMFPSGSPKYLDNNGDFVATYTVNSFDLRAFLRNEAELSFSDSSMYNPSSSRYFSIEAWTVYDGNESMHTTVKFRFLPVSLSSGTYAVQIWQNDVNERNMYDGRYFNVTNGLMMLPLIGFAQ